MFEVFITAFSPHLQIGYFPPLNIFCVKSLEIEADIVVNKMEVKMVALTVEKVVYTDCAVRVPTEWELVGTRTFNSGKQMVYLG